MPIRKSVNSTIKYSQTILLFSQICNPSDIFFKQFCHFVSAYCRQLHLCVHSYFVQITTFLLWNTTFSLYLPFSVW